MIYSSMFSKKERKRLTTRNFGILYKELNIFIPKPLVFMSLFDFQEVFFKIAFVKSLMVLLRYNTK